MKLKFISVLAVAAGLAVAGCGSGDDDSSASATKGNSTDRAFVAAMIPHHDSAIDMARVAQERGQSEFVKSLAKDIINTQSAEISTMKREDEGLDNAGVKKASLGVDEHMMGMDMDMDKLETSKSFDRDFMTMMIEHHQGAITMAKAELDRGGDPELKGLADDIVMAQQGEITEMRKQLGEDAPSSDMKDGHSM